MAIALRRVAGRRHGRKVHQAADNRPSVPRSMALVQGLPPGLTAGQTHDLVALVVAQDGSDLDVQVAWQSSNTAVVTVKVTGQLTARVTAVGAGTATVTGWPVGFKDVTDLNPTVSYTVSGSAPTPDSIEIVEGVISGQPGQTFMRSGQVKDAGGIAISGRSPTWSVDNTAVATVTANDASADPLHQTTAPGVTLVADGSTTLRFTDGALVATRAITVSTPGGVQPFMTISHEGYTSTADYITKAWNAGGVDVWHSGTNPSGTYGPASEFKNQGRVTLVAPGDLPAALTDTKVRRDTWPAQALNNDAGVVHPVRFPSAVTELWVECWGRFSPDWTSDDPANPGSPGLKWFQFRVNGGGGRFGSIINSTGNKWTWGYPGNEGFESLKLWPSAVLTNIANDLWYRHRFHCKVGASGRARWMIATADGSVQRVVSDSGVVTINRTNIYGCHMGNNLNEKPATVAGAMYNDYATVKFFNADPGWSWP